MKFTDYIKTIDFETQQITTTGNDPITANDTVWRDEFGRINAKNLDTAVGHWDWLDGYIRVDNTQTITNDNHALYLVTQLNHDVDYRTGAYTSLHIHWVQEQDPATYNPMWVLWYKIVPTGGAVPSSWTESTILTANVFDYDNAGAQDQITTFSHIDISGLNVSSRIHWKLYRYGPSSLDTYQQYLLLSDIDIHVPKYTLGSQAEITR